MNIGKYRYSLSIELPDPIASEGGERACHTERRSAYHEEEMESHALEVSPSSS